MRCYDPFCGCFHCQMQRRGGKPTSWTAELYIGRDHFKTMEVRTNAPYLYTAFFGPMPSLECMQEMDVATTLTVKTWRWKLMERTGYRTLKYVLEES